MEKEEEEGGRGGAGGGANAMGFVSFALVLPRRHRRAALIVRAKLMKGFLSPPSRPQHGIGMVCCCCCCCSTLAANQRRLLSLGMHSMTTTMTTDVGFRAAAAAVVSSLLLSPPIPRWSRPLLNVTLREGIGTHDPAHGARSAQRAAECGTAFRALF